MILPKGKRSLNIRSRPKATISLSEVPRIGPCKAPTTTPIGRPWIRLQEKRVGLGGKPGLTRRIQSASTVGTNWSSPPTTETTPWELARLSASRLDQWQRHPLHGFHGRHPSTLSVRWLESGSRFLRLGQDTRGETFFGRKHHNQDVVGQRECGDRIPQLRE